MMLLSDIYSTYLPWIEEELRDLLTSPEPDVARHYDIMQYALGWRDVALQPVSAAAGKRIRPVLCLLACAAACGDPQRALPAAAGLELLHNFSLIHDDIEDNSPTRRHRPTVWTLFGMPIACNAGDGMFSLGHLAFFRLARRGLPADRIVAALQLFDCTCLALTEGQYLDMSFETRLNVTVEEYIRMIAGKTGALLAAAPEIGALVGGATVELASVYRRYGSGLGRAFQIQDDILGIWGDETLTGKSTASDVLSKKKTLPVLQALAHEAVGPRLAALYAGPPFTEADVPRVLGLLEEANARAQSEAAVLAGMAEAQSAVDALAGHCEPEPLAGMIALLESLAGRRQ